MNGRGPGSRLPRRRYERQQMVQRISREVRQGIYRIDPRAVAEAMMGKELVRRFG